MLGRIFLNRDIRLAAAYASAAIRILGCRRFDLHMLIEVGSKPAQGFFQPLMRHVHAYVGRYAGAIFAFLPARLACHFVTLVYPRLTLG
jgi:hypothetical protein